MKILIITELFPRPSEEFILREFNELIRQGEECSVLSCGPHGQKESAGKEGLLSLIFAWLRIFPLLAGCSLSGAIRHGWRAARLFLITPRPQHVHAHFANLPAFIGYGLSKAWRVPLTVSIHARDVFVPWLPGIKATSRARSIIACSKTVAKAYSDSVGPAHPPVHLIHHGVPLDGLPEYSPSSSHPILFSAGRLVPKKGFITLLNAIPLLLTRFPQLQLRIAGEGTQRIRIEEIINERNIRSHVTLLGDCSQDVITREMSQANLFCLACQRDPDGDQDGIPNVLLEAMAIGVPVIAGSAGGTEEVVLDGITGFLVKSADASALAATIERCLLIPEKLQAISKEAKVRLRRNHSLGTNITQMRSILQGVHAHEEH